MKVFVPIRETVKQNRSEILNELRSIIEKQKPGLRRDSFLSLTNDREDQFFLKSGQNFILWTKIYFEPFKIEKAEQLKIEQEEMTRKFLQPLKLQVFFGEGEIDYMRAGIYPEAEYFRYSMIQSSGEKAMIIEPMEPPIFAASGEVKKPVSLQGNLKQAQLTRNELADLIDLSLDLKRT